MLKSLDPMVERHVSRSLNRADNSSAGVDRSSVPVGAVTASHPLYNMLTPSRAVAFSDRGAVQMDRSEFDAIRNMNGKVIVDDIRFSRRHSARPLLTAENIEVINDAGVNLRLNITFNPEVDSKTINVHVPGTGPICRLDVDGTVHRDAGRSHKHSLQTGRCSDRNLPDNVDARDDLSGRTLRGVFDEFCALANITLEGEFESPPED